MNEKNLDTYKAYVISRLRELSPFLRNYALGDFSAEIEIPAQEDEFTELLVGITLMVDDFREMVAELQKTQRELFLKNIVFESAIAANSIADPEGIIKVVNEAFIKMWGYESMEDAIGNPVASFFVNQEDVAPVMEALNQTGKWQGEFLAKKQDGSQFISRGYATVIRDEADNLIGYQSTNLDITDQKKQEKIIRQHAEEMAQKNEDLERFNRLAVGREHRMIELKREVNALAEELGREPPYDLSFAS